MLVLSRSSSEGVLIAEDIEIVVLEVKGDTVKLGFKAPRDVRIMRSEVLAEVASSNQDSASSAADLTAVADLPTPAKK